MSRSKKVNNFENELSKLSIIKPYKMFFAIFVDWLIIILTIFICNRAFSWPFYFLSIVIISSRMHALGILSHDAVHYRIGLKKTINDLIANVFLCWPLFIRVEGYRNEHFPHHQFVNTDLDPDFIRKKHHSDWQFPKRFGSMFKIFLFDILGLNLGQYFNRLKFSLKYESKGKRKDRNKGMELLRLFFYFNIFTLIYFNNLGNDFFLYWVIPYITFFKMIRRLRTLAEHFAISNPSEYKTRTVLTSFFDILLLSPHYVNFHGEHHLFPQVPFYNLKKLHYLLSSHPVYKGKLYYTKSYVGVIKEAINYKLNL